MMNLIIIYLLISTLLTIAEYISALLTAKKLHLNLSNVTLFSAAKWIVGIPLSPFSFVLAIIVRILVYIVLKMYSKEVINSIVDNVVEKDKSCKTEEDKILLRACTLNALI